MDVKLQTRVTQAARLPNGQQEITLSSGHTLVTDVYVPTFGLVPNSSYVPSQLRNVNGSIAVDEYLQVKGANSVWAIGDVADIEPAQFIVTDKQSLHLVKNITAVLNNQPPLPYKVAGSRKLSPISALELELGISLIYLAGFMGLQIGRKAAVGHFGSMRVPSFIIAKARKTLFIQNLKPTVDGSLY